MRPASAFLNLLFPPRCLGCERRGSCFCDRCRHGVRAVAEPFCPICHLEVDPTSPLCRCAHPALLYTTAAGEYDGPLRRAVLQFKFHGRRAAAPALAALMHTRLTPLPGPDWLLVPVPLHAERLRERGYNQAALLAAELARLAAREYQPRALRRVKRTVAQTTLEGRERRRNVAEAFVGSEYCRNRRILLVDDVCTTGATLQAAAIAAKRAGAAQVYGTVLARTVHHGT